MKKSKRTTIARGVAGAVLVSSLLFACGKGLNNPNRPDYFNFRNFAPSGMLRTMGVPQITLAMEHAMGGNFPAGYRRIPDPFADDEAQWVKAEHPTSSCGTTQATIEERAADCALEWDGEAKAGGAAAKWRLVTKLGVFEVWQDMRTGLLWSDKVVAAATWCQATGYQQNIAENRNQASYAPGDGIDCSSNAINYCGDSMTLEPRGNLGNLAWRLPTSTDWKMAEIDGIRWVHSDILSSFWSSSIADYTGTALMVSLFDGTNGNIGPVLAGLATPPVICLAAPGAR